MHVIVFHGQDEKVVAKLSKSHMDFDLNHKRNTRATGWVPGGLLGDAQQHRARRLHGIRSCLAHCSTCKMQIMHLQLDLDDR